MVLVSPQFLFVNVLHALLGIFKVLYFTKEIYFVTASLLPRIMKPFQNRVYFQVAIKNFSYGSILSRLKMETNGNDRDASSKVYQFT